MSKIKKLFKQHNSGILNIFVTAGYPYLQSTTQVMLGLQQHGADIIELGMPYSDPIADGPVIQHSNEVALKNGMTMPVLFEQLNAIKDQMHIPVVLMGYLNPVLQFGVEKFCQEASAAGVSGVIIPDMPFYEYERFYAKIFKQYGLDVIFLVCPDTDTKRLKIADKLSSGFLYAVSSSATTGHHDDVTDYKDAWYKKIADLPVNNPVLIGFGISNREQFQKACGVAAGAIVGSAFIQAVQHAEPPGYGIEHFLKGFKDVNN